MAMEEELLNSAYSRLSPANASLPRPPSISLSLSLPGGSLATRRKVNEIHTTTPHLPHGHKCVRAGWWVGGGGQGIMFAFLPEVVTLPLPAESRGQARCPQWNPADKHGSVCRGGGRETGLQR